jgi:hypothetical protein
MQVFLRTIFFIPFLNGFIFFSYSQTVISPVINYVTVNHSTQKPEIYWNYENPVLIDGYSIIRLIYSHPLAAPMTYQIIHTINDSEVQFYQDFSESFGLALPNERIENYKIIAFNIEGTDTIFSLPSVVHRTILLHRSYDYCTGKILLTWNKYNGWNETFDQYDIYCKRESDAYIKIGSTYHLDDTLYSAVDILPQTTYKFYIKALNTAGFESNSNEISYYTESPQIPSFLKCDSLIVDSENSIQMYFNIDNIPDIFNFNLFKSEDDAPYYESILRFNDQSNRIQLSDPSFNYELRNSYFLEAEDYCGRSLIISDTISNIVLKVTDSIKQNGLQWSSMDVFPNYDIFRSIDVGYENIATSNQLSFNDNISDIFNNQFSGTVTQGKYCYYVEGIKTDFLSRSNSECIDKKAVYYFPNAFNPNSSIEENRTFKPKLAYITNFHLLIYDHSGSKIFETHNPFYGWDGKLPNGRLAPISSYIYYSSFTNSKGEKIKLKGIVSLVY